MRLNFLDDLLGLDGIGSGPSHRSPNVVDDDGRATLCKLQRIRASQTTPGAGDDSDSAVEVQLSQLQTSSSATQRSHPTRLDNDR
jgi:hypothetical protein